MGARKDVTSPFLNRAHVKPARRAQVEQKIFYEGNSF